MTTQDDYGGRCPACAHGLHDDCDPLVPWLCSCTSGACLARLLTPHPRGSR